MTMTLHSSYDGLTQMPISELLKVSKQTTKMLEQIRIDSKKRR